MTAGDDACRILLAEDDDEHAELFQFVLGGLEHELVVDRVRDGEAALAYLLGEPPYEGRARPDLVFVDLNLPRMDGLDVLRALRDRDPDRSVAILMLTTSNSPRDRSRALALGVNAYLVKPLDFGELRELARDTLTFWLKWALPPDRD